MILNNKTIYIAFPILECAPCDSYDGQFNEIIIILAKMTLIRIPIIGAIHDSRQ